LAVTFAVEYATIASKPSSSAARRTASVRCAYSASVMGSMGQRLSSLIVLPSFHGLPPPAVTT
jgi:hypothetical protein